MTLSIDSSKVSLDDMHMPAVIDTISITGKLITDKKNTENTSGATTTVNGWANATITISLIVLDDPAPNTASKKLAKIVDAFHAIDSRAMDPQNKPPLYTLSCPISEAWGIHTVRLEELSSSIDRNSDAIQVTLKLAEENTTQRLIAQRTPPPATTEKTQTAQAQEIPNNELSLQQRRTLHERLGRTS